MIQHTWSTDRIPRSFSNTTSFYWDLDDGHDVWQMWHFTFEHSQPYDHLPTAKHRNY